MMRATAPALLVLLAGCQDYLFERVVPTRVAEKRHSVLVEPTPADILFVVDNSGSMEDEQLKLAESFDRFIRVISASAEKGLFHIAIVTTDLDGKTSEQRGTKEFNFGPPPYNHWLGTIKRDDCGDLTPPIGHGCFRGPVIVSGETTQEQEINTFKSSVAVGSCGSGAEQGLTVMLRALENARDGVCNQEFLRPEANLVVVIVSDEDDNVAGVPPPTVAMILEQLTRIKPLEKIRFAGVIGSVDGEASACRIANGATTATCGSICSMMPAPGSQAPCKENAQCLSGQTCQGAGEMERVCENELLNTWSDCASCSYYQTEDCCSANGAYRYVDFAREVEARVTGADGNLTPTGCRASPNNVTACLIDSICQVNFGDTLAEIAEELVIPFVFTLDPPALNLEGIKVVFRGPNGEIVLGPEEFMVSSNGTQLKLTGRKPMRGDTVEIYFITDL